MKFNLKLDGIILARYDSQYSANAAMLRDSAYTKVPINHYQIVSIHDFCSLGICRDCRQITGREDEQCCGFIRPIAPGRWETI